MEPAWLLVLPAYLLGTFPSAHIVGRFVGRDPTREGSRNPGATNMVRVAGRRAGAAVLLADVAKGALATGVGLALAGPEVGIACGVAAVAGHVCPITRPSRGGKGVATFGGALIVVYPIVAAALLALWILVVATTRKASVASIVTAAVAPVVLAVLGEPVVEVVLVAGAALVIIARHRGNVRRLLRGEELQVSP